MVAAPCGLALGRRVLYAGRQSAAAAGNLQIMQQLIRTPTRGDRRQTLWFRDPLQTVAQVSVVRVPGKRAKILWNCGLSARNSGKGKGK